jgi:thiol-disulfide isomerase/thioredoxin
MMPVVFSRIVVACLLGVILLIAGLSCSKTETTRSQLPEFLPDSTVTQIRELINLGYAQLDSAKLQEAVASFAQVSRLIPNGLVGEYHTACAYALTDDKEQAFSYLTRLVDSGFDNPEQLNQDPDFETLKSDPRFESLLARALENFSKSSAALAAGMPDYETPPLRFATEEEFNAWADEQNRSFRTQYRFWRSGDALLAQIDFAARRLACLRELKKNDTTFDYSLERVRALAHLKSPYEASWGVVSDLVVREVDTYLHNNPSPTGQSEAHFQAGLALSLKYSEQNNQRVEGFRQAEDHLTKVPEGTAYHGAALALIAINKLRSPDADLSAAGQELKNVIERFPGDEKLYRIVSTQTQNEAARYLWPLKLEKPDITNANVSLADYTGKVLLIDFWAIWCPPCRAELPNVREVYKEYHPKGFEIVSVSLDYSEEMTPEAYRQWIDSAGMSWRHIYDGAAWDTELVKRFFVGSIPAPFLVGKDGSLVATGDDLRGESLALTVRGALGI